LAGLTFETVFFVPKGGREAAEELDSFSVETFVVLEFELEVLFLSKNERAAVGISSFVSVFCFGALCERMSGAEEGLEGRGAGISRRGFCPGGKIFKSLSWILPIELESKLLFHSWKFSRSNATTCVNLLDEGRWREYN
jgi:hypothetical protein